MIEQIALKIQIGGRVHIIYKSYGLAKEVGGVGINLGWHLEGVIVLSTTY